MPSGTQQLRYQTERKWVNYSAPNRDLGELSSSSWTQYVSLTFAIFEVDNRRFDDSTLRP
jgi:hypothetical protein